MMGSPGIASPGPGEYAPYYETYISRVRDADILALLESGAKETVAVFERFVDDAASVRPAPDEWSVKEVLSHLCEFERVFAYRAMYFAAGVEVPLPTFDQDQFIAGGNARSRPLADLLAEFIALRQGTLLLFKGMSEAQQRRRGIASDAEMSARAVAFVIAGHEAGHRGDVAKMTHSRKP